MKTNPKNLGKAAEREFVLLLNDLMLNGEIITEKEEFRRVIGSGAHGRLFDKMPYEVQNTFVGDIHGPTNFPFVIECKRRNGSPDFYKIILNKSHDVHGWLQQVENDADKMNKEPLLLMKFIRRGFFVIISYKIYNAWNPPYRSKLPHTKFNFYSNGTLYTLISWESFEDLVITDFEGWLKKEMQKDVR